MESDVTNVRDAVAAGNERFVATFARQDAAGLAELYTESANLLPPNSDILEGRPAIQAFWQAVMNMGIRSAQLDIVEVEALGDMAIEMSRFKLLTQDGQVADYGKYVVVWKREKGEWRLHRDIFNSSRPLSP
jgi:uncharacterized protein (TIGR02246 family)